MSGWGGQWKTRKSFRLHPVVERKPIMSSACWVVIWPKSIKDLPDYLLQALFFPTWIFDGWTAAAALIFRENWLSALSKMTTCLHNSHLNSTAAESIIRSVAIYRARRTAGESTPKKPPAERVHARMNRLIKESISGLIRGPGIGSGLECLEKGFPWPKKWSGGKWGFRWSVWRHTLK